MRNRTEEFDDLMLNAVESVERQNNGKFIEIAKRNNQDIEELVTEEDQVSI